MDDHAGKTRWTRQQVAVQQQAEGIAFAAEGLQGVEKIKRLRADFHKQWKAAHDERRGGNHA
jgi:hypothetical protein